MIVPKYFEDLNVLHKNTMPNRAYYIPASVPMDLQPETRETSDRFLLLSGDWKFRYFENIYDVKEEFFQDGYDTATFDEVKVPGVWQNYGYDHHQYTNVRYPFPMDPPYVPVVNPCGAYVRYFSYKKDSKAPKTYLNFEGVDSCFYVWVNGSFVGYSQVSHSTSEFDVTELLREGENTLAVLVVKWCDGSYFEDQDKFRMSGIFRDVYLLNRPENGIHDYFVKAIPSEDYQDGTITIDFTYRKEPVPVNITLSDAEGKTLAQVTAEGQVSVPVKNAHLWSAEDPYLYKLVLSTGEEAITEQVGIREIHTEKGVLYINGVKVKFHGTNRHDSDPVTGFAISLDQIKKDLTLMKEHNMNAIRTSHYPNAPHFYQLYDRLGFFIIDEADNESHGTSDIYDTDPSWESRSKRWNEIIADNPLYTESTVDRTQRCVERDKNRPSVVIWSMGNECAYGCTFEEALRWTKKFDSTRLTHYESSRYVSDKRKYDYSVIDLQSRMYPSLDEIRDYFKEDGTKPFVMCEYCHSMGNGPGDLEDYFEVIQSYDGACGAFMWEWCDHAIDLGKTIKGKKVYAYGGDHNEYPHDGNFCMDGLVYPDRTPHTGLLEFKNVHRPVRVISFDQEKGTAVLHNYMDFTNLKDLLMIRYEASIDGVTVENGIIDDPAVLDLPAHEEKEITLPVPQAEKGKCFLKLTYLLKEATEVLPAGFELGFDELAVKTAENVNQTAKALLAASDHAEKNFALDEDDHYLIVSSDDFCYTYNKLTGVFAKMVYKNQSLLDRPMEYNIWRAPTDNDRNIKLEWMKAQYDRIVTRAYETKVHKTEKEVKIETTLSISAIYIQRILDIQVTWNIQADGTVDIAMDVKRNPIFPMLPRFGLRLFLPKEMKDVTYYGLGPVESYMDKRRASWHGEFSSPVTDLHEDYIRPQENGSHYDCDYVTLSSNAGHLLPERKTSLTAVSGQTFSFNASVYTEEELTNKAHHYELEECGSTVLCLDYRQNGIGSNSCGPQLIEKYRLDETEFHFELRLKPEA